MPRVLFIQNGETEGPGLLAAALAGANLELATIHAWRGEVVPTSSDGFAGIAIGGGAMSACQTAEYPTLLRQIGLAQETRAAGKAMLGLCLGAQLMAAAFGGRVFANTAKEIGLHPVRLTPECALDPLWRGCPTTLHPVHWHGDTFSLPPAAAHLAASDLTAQQLFRLDRALYGLQFHLEIDLPMLREMIATDADALCGHGVDPEAFLAEAERHLPALEPIARTIFTRWAALLAS
jgi:GMP synthase-like glutamine amidotransferase